MKAVEQRPEIFGTGRFELPTPRTPSGITIFSVIYPDIPRPTFTRVESGCSSQATKGSDTVIIRQLNSCPIFAQSEESES